MKRLIKASYKSDQAMDTYPDDLVIIFTNDYIKLLKDTRDKAILNINIHDISLYLPTDQEILVTDPIYQMDITDSIARVECSSVGYYLVLRSKWTPEVNAEYEIII